MREIKFRAWDKRNSTMYLQGEATRLWSAENEYFAGVMSGKPAISYDNDFNGDNYNQTYSDDNPYLELMQYTGLKDKNGKEIYEGDIVKLSEYDEKLPENLEVKWATNGYHLYAKDAIGWRSSLAWHDDKFDIEVIGNIYENPELLK